MGYPMTIRRFLGRHLVKEGAEGRASQVWQTWGPYTIPDHPDKPHFDMWRDEREKLKARLMMMAEDLERLERDTLDEAAVNERIRQLTGLGQDTVAAVLQAYWSI